MLQTYHWSDDARHRVARYSENTRKLHKFSTSAQKKISKNMFTFAIFPSFPVKRLIINNFYLITKIHNNATLKPRQGCASYKYILIRTTCSCKSGDVEKFDRVVRSAFPKVRTRRNISFCTKVREH